MIYEKYAGFTLLEVLITVGILSVLATIGFGYYRNYAKQIEIQLTAKALVADLLVQNLIRWIGN